MPESRLSARFLASSSTAWFSLASPLGGRLSSSGFQGRKPLFAHANPKGELSQVPSVSISCRGSVGSGGGVSIGILPVFRHLQHSFNKLLVTHNRAHLFLPEVKEIAGKSLIFLVCHAS